MSSSVHGDGTCVAKLMLTLDVALVRMLAGPHPGPVSSSRQWSPPRTRIDLLASSGCISPKQLPR